MMTTSRRALLTGLCAATLPISARAAATAAPVLAKAMEGTKTPGMAAIVIRDYKAEPEMVAGIRRLGAPGLIAPGDRWHPGSDGKAMTVTMIARLVERGVLAWDRPLDQMLPSLAAKMRPEYRDVTLPDLMSPFCLRSACNILHSCSANAVNIPKPRLVALPNVVSRA